MLILQHVELISAAGYFLTQNSRDFNHEMNAYSETGAGMHYTSPPRSAVPWIGKQRTGTEKITHSETWKKYLQERKLSAIIIIAVADSSGVQHHKELWFEQFVEKYPSWPKGHPWKGCRSLIAARGFKSLLLRLRAMCESTWLFFVLFT